MEFPRLGFSTLTTDASRTVPKTIARSVPTSTKYRLMLTVTDEQILSRNTDHALITYKPSAVAESFRLSNADEDVSFWGIIGEHSLEVIVCVRRL